MLRIGFATSGTDRGDSASVLRIDYGTDISTAFLYAVSGTDRGYAAPRLLLKREDLYAAVLEREEEKTMVKS